MNLILSGLWDILSSRGAIIIYVILILVIFGVLVISVIFFEKRREIENEEIYGESNDKAVKDIVENVTSSINKSNNELKEVLLDTQDKVIEIVKSCFD